MFRKVEGTVFTISGLLLNTSNQPQSPTTLRYRIDCETTGQQVVDWTTLTPAPQFTVTWTAAIVSRSNLIERKTLSVESDAGLSTACVDEYQFEVRRRNQ